ncbi:MAG: flavodoxin family protein [Oscillospiraceae bacterium]|nr:flavodoxin family protein [Oscillospiraceae bacterium]
MKVFAINGSPRDKHNTAKMLDAFLDGVISAGVNADVKRIDLYKYSYKGCTECFGCKVKGSENYGKCCYKDDITDILSEVASSDIVVFGSPVYFGGITGQLTCFLERLFYPFTAFKKDAERVIAPRKIKTVFLHTMNISEEMAKMAGYENSLSGIHRWVQHIFGYEPVVRFLCDIYQLDNYDQFEFDIWDWDAKKKRHDEVFPKELDSFKELGRKIACEL